MGLAVKRAHNKLTCHFRKEEKYSNLSQHMVSYIVLDKICVIESVFSSRSTCKYMLRPLFFQAVVYFETKYVLPKQHGNIFI